MINRLRCQPPEHAAQALVGLGEHRIEGWPQRVHKNRHVMPGPADAPASPKSRAA